MTLFITILLLVFLRGFLRRIAILLAVIAGWAMAALMDALNLGHAQNAAGDEIDRIAWQTTTPGGEVLTLGDAGWFGLPEFTAPSFSFTAFLLFLPVVIVLIAENAGHVKAVSEMTGADLDPDLGRAFMGDGAATALAGTFGGAGTTTYAENIGVMAATRIYSTAAYIIAAFAAILFGLCPKFGVLVGSIPAGVLGGVTIVLYGMIAVLGAKIWVSNRVDFGKTSNLVPAAAGIILGAGDVTCCHRRFRARAASPSARLVTIVVYHLFRVAGRRMGADPEPPRPRESGTGTREAGGPRLLRCAGALASPSPSWRVLAEVGAGAARCSPAGRACLPVLSMRLAAPAHLVDINRRHRARCIRVDEAGVRVGALARHAGVERDSRPPPRVQPLLGPGAAALVAHPGHPQPGHHGGQHRARRPERGDDRGAGPARREGGGRERPRAPDGPGRRLLRRAAGVRRAPRANSRSGVLPRAARRARAPAFVEVSRRHGDYAVCGLAAVVTSSTAS